MKRISLLALLMVFLTTGCGFELSRTYKPSVAAERSALPPANYREMIQARFIGILSYADASGFTFDKPVKAHLSKNADFGTQSLDGWLVCGTMERRHIMGGYTSVRYVTPYFAFFKDGEIAEALFGSDDPASSTNAFIHETCASSNQAPAPVAE